MPQPMVSMELDDESKLDATGPFPLPEKPDYPYGLRICLTHEEFDKLGLDPSEAFVGGICHLHALARITSVSANDSGSGATCRVEMQITDLVIEAEDSENSEYD